jgi:hypothetical protein
VQTFPACIVKTLGIAGKMFFREAPRLFDVFRGEDLSRKVRFHDVLQPGNFGMVEEAAPGAHVGVNEARVRRVLPPMRELVAVGIEDRIKA